MALHGSIDEAGLANVLQLLALGGKTGCVAVERKPVHGAIYVEGGAVVWAEIVSRGDRLGDHLVRSGKITREQLRHAIETLTHNASLTLAEVLVSSEILALGELDRFVQHQVEEAIYLMCSWADGQFTFTANVRPPRHAVPVALQAASLVEEAGRRADDWQVIHQAIPSFDRVYKRGAVRHGATAPQLTSEQHRILPLLDGTRDVNGLIELSGLSTFEVAKALLELIMAGAVQLQERRASAKHFDDAELRDYAYKQGDFTDPERRKDAARHIADCQMCGTRLREFHLRRTSQAVPAPDQASRPTVPRAPTPPVAPPPPPPAPAPADPAAPGFVVADVKAPPPAPRAPQRPPPAATPPAGSRPTSDFVWLMSPEEADEQRRSQHRTRTADAEARTTVPAKPTTPPSSAAAAPPAATTPATPPAVAATPLSAAAPPAPTAPPAPPKPKPAMQTAARLIAVPPPRPEAQPPHAGEPETAAEPVAAAAPPPSGAKWRVPAIAAAGIVMVAGGYLAMRSLGGRGAAPVETAAATSPPPAASAPAASEPAAAVPLTTPADSAVAPRGAASTAKAESSTVRPRADTARPAPVQAPRDTPVTRAPAPETPAASAPVAARTSAPTPAPVAVEPLAPDAELASGGWRVIERAEATSALGGHVATIPGLRIESFASSEARGRTRVRVAQIARTGQRIVLIETASGESAATSARATAVSVMPPLEGSGESIGSASLANLQITARSTLTPEALRPLLGRLALAR